MTKRFLFLNLGHAYTHLFMLLYPTAVLTLERELSRDYGALLLPSTAGFVAFAAGTLPAGWLGDRWNREPMIAAMFFGLGLGAILTGLATTPLELSAGLAVIGLFASIYHPVGIAMVVETAAPVGRALGINGVFGNLGVAAAPLIAAGLSTAWSWRAAFLVPGALALVTGLGYLVLVRGREAGIARCGPEDPPPASPALRRRVFIFVALASLFGGAVFSAMSIALPKMVAEALADPTSTGVLSAGALAAAIFVVAAFAQLVTGRAVDRRSPRALMLGLAGGQVLLFGFLALAVGWPVLLLGLAVMPLVFGEIPIHDAMVARYGAARWRARLFAVKYVLSLGVGAVAVPLVAWLHAPGASPGNGFVGLYLVLAGAAAMVAVGSLLLPGGRPAR